MGPRAVGPRARGVFEGFFLNLRRGREGSDEDTRRKDMNNLHIFLTSNTSVQYVFINSWII